jgi:hypothetical protein
VTPDGHSLTININASAATAGRPTSTRRRKGLDMRQRHQRARQRRQEERKATLATAYAEKKAAGLSYRRAYAELGGNSDEARAAWRAALSPEVAR